MHILERNNAKECIRVYKNIIRSENDVLTGFSALDTLLRLAHGDRQALDSITEGFLTEFIYLNKGLTGSSEVYKNQCILMDIGDDERQAARNRSDFLDSYSLKMKRRMAEYSTGMDEISISNAASMRREILDYFNATEDDWYDTTWHLNHIIKDLRTLSSIVKLEDDEIDGLKAAKQYNIPVHITPYYLSLFNKGGRCDSDRAIRAQVIPSLTYCENVYKNRQEGKDLDFMGEKSTSPVDLITRRYPQILILKPYDSCPQICVYCQRNWEIKSMDEAQVTRSRIENAIQWIRQHESITEVLVTGGDPLTLNNSYLDWLLGELAAIGHVERIRIGTRIPVTLPFRIDDGLIEIFEKYHRPGRREVCIVTHFEHASEMTPDAVNAISKIRRAGMSVYNQQVFTYYNSRKYETVQLRKVLKLCGIDPYYSFNTKGKEETIDFRVPIARIEQERKEEARLLPGIVRTDEPVFNVPRLGKSHLRAWQDHEVIMIMANGERAYRFYPWESKLTICDTYVYCDVSIYMYLKRLSEDGEDLDEYRSIWYYF